MLPASHKGTIIIAFIVPSSNSYAILKFNSNVISQEGRSIQRNLTMLNRQIRRGKPRHTLMSDTFYAFVRRQTVLLCSMPWKNSMEILPPSKTQQYTNNSRECYDPGLMTETSHNEMLKPHSLVKKPVLIILLFWKTFPRGLNALLV